MDLPRPFTKDLTDPQAKEKVEELDKKFIPLAITSISVMELWKGAQQSKQSDKKKKKINELIQSLSVFAFSIEDAKKAGNIEVALKRRGKLIDVEDIMIAGTAQARAETILTRDGAHFSFVAGIDVETY